METDDGIRSKSGIVFSLRENESGTVTMILDDVINSSGTTKSDWRHDGAVTWKSYSQADLEIENLSNKELESIGLYVVSRLLAQKSVRKK